MIARRMPVEVEDERATGLVGAVSAELAALRRGFTNWPGVAARIAGGRLLRRPPAALTLRTRRGPVLRTPAGDRTWWTAVEVFGHDSYNLEQMVLPPAPVFVDVGANIGAFALGVLARWPAAQGACYEPSPHAYAALTANLGTDDCGGRVQAHAAAVTGTAELTTVRLFERPSDSCTSTLLPPRAGSKSTVPGRWVEVPAQSLQAVLAQWSGGVDLLKIDVEGAEYDIIRGTPLASLMTIKHVVVEYHAVDGHSVADLAERFGEAGFVWRRWERSAIHGQGLCWWERSGSTEPR
jgi:FkbM family methyltransferase